MNKAILKGNLGADPELRYTQGGQAVLNMRLATTERYVDKDGAKQERTDWHTLTLWGKRGEALAQHLKKGSSILVEGRIQTSSYEKDGEKRYKTEINVTELEFCDGAREAGDGARSGGRAAAPYGTSGAGANAKHTTPPGDDLPF